MRLEEGYKSEKIRSRGIGPDEKRKESIGR
jgi:hypothetical protein